MFRPACLELVAVTLLDAAPIVFPRPAPIPVVFKLPWMFADLPSEPSIQRSPGRLQLGAGKSTAPTTSSLNSPRRVVFSRPSAFQVSANSGVAPERFGGLNATYPDTFQTFSAPRCSHLVLPT